MRGQLYLDTMHADRTNLIMRYLSIRRSDLETRHTVATVRISRSFSWYAMNELMHVIQSWFLGYMDGHSSHLPWLNHGCKIECLHQLKIFMVLREAGWGQLPIAQFCFQFHKHHRFYQIEKLKFQVYLQWLQMYLF